MTEFKIRTATEADVPVILNLIRDLATYERAPDAVVATEAGLREVLFGAKSSAEVLLALENAEPVGFAVFFHNFSTCSDGRDFISKICSLGRRNAGKVMGALCWGGWRKLRRSVAAAGWSGRCSIGTIPRSNFTGSSARNR